MTKKNSITLQVVCVLLALVVSASSPAQENRKINQLIVDDYYEGQIQLSLLKPKDYWVLIVLDSNLSNAHEYIKQLQQQKVDMSATIIVLLNSANSKQLFYDKYHASLQPYSWVNAQSNNILTQLHIAATPVSFGIYKDIVKWQNSGHPNNFDEAMLLGKQLQQWTSQKVQK